MTLVQDYEKYLWKPPSLAALKDAGCDVLTKHTKYSPDLNAIEAWWNNLRQRLEDNAPTETETREQFLLRLRTPGSFVLECGDLLPETPELSPRACPGRPPSAAPWEMLGREFGGLAETVLELPEWKRARGRMVTWLNPRHRQAGKRLCQGQKKRARAVLKLKGAKCKY